MTDAASSVEFLAKLARACADRADAEPRPNAYIAPARLREIAGQLECQETERTTLRNLLTDIQPLLAECDCIHSDPENPVQCPCKRLRAELAKP